MGCFRALSQACRNVRQFMALVVVACLMMVLLWCFNNWRLSDNEKIEWTHRELPQREPHSEHFVMGRDAEIYMYSAFVNLPDKESNDSQFFLGSNTTEIIITSLDKSPGNYTCCVLASDGETDKKTLFETHALIYPQKVGGTKSFPAHYIMRQFSCTVPNASPRLLYSHISLASANCSTDLRDFLPILQPRRVPGGMAVCAKIAHSGGLDPEKVIEWFEVLRLLGVDKVLIFDLGNPESLNRVFKYYQDLGILDLQPYDLPGKPKNRSLQERWKKTPQFFHDETMVVLECRQRLAGYDYIIGHDVDEMIIPRKNVSLKDFVKEKLLKEPNAAGFVFYVEFFITTWKPSNPEESLMVKRYRESTVPRWECYKYVYLPSRVTTAGTHGFSPNNARFKERRVPPEEAILHHYRQCPEDTWKTCSVKTNIDNIMTRYLDLDERVRRVQNATNTHNKSTVKPPGL